jgi:hypothetical protein
VLLEFRYSLTDAAGAVSDNLLNKQAAILLNDGSIVQPDGVSLPEFTGGTLANLYVIVWHRNHLGVMSATNLVETDGNYSYDFTDDLTKAYQDGHSALGGGMYGMTAGDSNGDGSIDDLDKDDNWSLDAGKQDYLGSDLNLDTQVNNPDKDDYWVPNKPASTTVPQ